MEYKSLRLNEKQNDNLTNSNDLTSFFKVLIKQKSFGLSNKIESVQIPPSGEFPFQIYSFLTHFCNSISSNNNGNYKET